MHHLGRGLVWPTALIVTVVLFDGCLPVTDLADGAGCAESRECKSGRCHDGFCGGSSCKLGDPSSCDAGWKCTHSKPDVVSEFFGSDGSDTCTPTCGHCPGNMHCAKDSPEGALCRFGKAPLELTITHQPTVLVGEPVDIAAFATPPAGRLVECTWDFGDGSPRETVSAAKTSHTFAGEGRAYGVRATCKDDGGRSGSAENSVTVSCVPTGARCANETVCCADGAMRCLDTPGSGLQCRAPRAPTIAIEGPSATPIRTEVEYRASPAGGDGTIRSIVWNFGDGPFEESGTPVRHSFRKAGLLELKVTVMTSVGARAEQRYPVTVCQVSGGSCDQGEPCCAPLTCTGTTFKRCEP